MCHRLQPHMHSHVSCTNCTTGSPLHCDDPTIGREGTFPASTCGRPVHYKRGMQDCTPTGQIYTSRTVPTPFTQQTQQHPCRRQDMCDAFESRSSFQVNAKVLPTSDRWPQDRCCLRTNAIRPAQSFRGSGLCDRSSHSRVWVKQRPPEQWYNRKNKAQIQYKHRSDTTVVCSGIRAKHTPQGQHAQDHSTNTITNSAKIGMSSHEGMQLLQAADGSSRWCSQQLGQCKQ